MKKIILILFLCLPVTLFANSIADYYNLVNEAELLVCSNKIEYALKHYDKAFECKETPFGKDLYNAWICAYILNDTVRFKKYSTTLISCGAFSNDAVTENLLRPISGTHDLAAFSSLWNRLKQTVVSTVDLNYSNELNKLLEKDQEVRNFFIAKCGMGYNKCGRDSINVFDSLNVVKLFDLFNTKGFPTEERCGYAGQFPSNPPVYQLILLHDRQWTGREIYDSVLYDEVFKGNFPTRDYALFKDHDYLNFKDSIASYQKEVYSYYGTDLCLKINGSNCFLNYNTFFSPEKRKRIEAARNSIYMDSIPEAMVKIKYQTEHSWFNFYGPDYIPFLEEAPDEFVVKMKSKSIKQEAINGLNNIGKQRCKYGLRH